MDDYKLESYICGFHSYKDMWNPVLEEVLACRRERQNFRDRYAVSVMNNETIVGHLPLNQQSVLPFNEKARHNKL